MVPRRVHYRGGFITAWSGPLVRPARVSLMRVVTFCAHWAAGETGPWFPNETVLVPLCWSWVIEEVRRRFTNDALVFVLGVVWTGPLFTNERKVLVLKVRLGSFMRSGQELYTNDLHSFPVNLTLVQFQLGAMVG